jgi:four helix bundle protein
MARVERFEDLEVWKSARELVRAIYKATSGSAFSRDAGLRGQIQRASVSVISNIAEGFERGGDKEFFQFLAQAKGSCGEVRSQLYVAVDQGYLCNELLDSLSKATARTSGMISNLMKYLGGSTHRGNKFRKSPSDLRP